MSDRFSTLRSALLLPFVAIVIAVALSIAALSYWTGQRAAASLTAQLLQDISDRVTQATTQHLAASKSALLTAAPEPIYAQGGVHLMIPKSLELIEERLWAATGLFPGARGYVYYGSELGAFVGINRLGVSPELRIGQSNSTERLAYTSFAPGNRAALLRTDSYDPRARPWYQAASKRGRLTWSPVYVDATSAALTVTLAKPVFDAKGDRLGVFATDIALTELSAFFSRLKISDNGVAFMIEPDGQLIASSVAEPLYRMVDGKQQRQTAGESNNALIRAAYQAMSKHQSPSTAFHVQHFEFDNGEAINWVAQTQSDEAGLNWTMVVAVPQSDHMADITKTAQQSAMIGVFSVLLALALAMWASHRVGADISRLARATQLLARGSSPTPLFAGRNDELGRIGRALQEFSTGLLTDPLTGALNRATFEKRFNTLVSQNSATHPVRFGIVFVDMNEFKQVNDVHGHAVGDAVLAVSARRLASVLREHDLLARFGGDEFLILLSSVQTDSQMSVAIRRLQSQLQPAVQIAGLSINIGASCGGALFSRDGATLEALIKAADERMFAAKKIHTTQ
ncbi:MAG: diguanylate cyclase [Betaproteobacteria bacterium]|nr:MAG: diguanylate cyclase [Betaproteobacteria bacterium]